MQQVAFSAANIVDKEKVLDATRELAEEAVHIFLSDDDDAAFERALEIGHQAERSQEQGRRWVESRLAEIMRLDYLGENRTEFQVVLGRSQALEYLPFEHMFDPEGNKPEPPF